MLSNTRAKLTDDNIAIINAKMDSLCAKILRQKVLYDDRDLKSLPGCGTHPSRDKFKNDSRKGYMFLTDPLLAVNNVVFQPVVANNVLNSVDGIEVCTQTETSFCCMVDCCSQTVEEDFPPSKRIRTKKVIDDM